MQAWRVIYKVENGPEYVCKYKGTLKDVYKWAKNAKYEIIQTQFLGVF